jgi:hypothetical protein
MPLSLCGRSGRLPGRSGQTASSSSDRAHVQSKAVDVEGARTWQPGQSTARFLRCMFDGLHRPWVVGVHVLGGRGQLRLVAGWRGTSPGEKMDAQSGTHQTSWCSAVVWHVAKRYQFAIVVTFAIRRDKESLALGRGGSIA